MGKLIHIILGALMASSALAQPAEKIATKVPKSAKPVSKAEKGVVPAAKVLPAVIIKPSRNVGASEIDSYVEPIASAFLIRTRERDPFGQSQDPDAKPVIKPTTVKGPGGRRPQVQSIEFSAIVQKIVVTTIMPGEQRFLIGTRSIKRGDELPLSFHGKQIRIQVTEVTSRQIGFRNLDTEEVAYRKLDMLPPGMKPGNRGITAPGMMPDRANAPIIIESDTPKPGDSAP